MKYRIKNWRKFQHYSKRNPPWIKLHVPQLLNSSDWINASASGKLALLCCLMAAALNDGSLPTPDKLPTNSGKTPDKLVASLCRLRQKLNLQPLVDSGFLIFDASTTLADASTTLATKTETEIEKEIEKKEIYKERKVRKRKHPIPNEWQVPKRAIEIATELKIDWHPIEGQFRDYLSSTGKQYIDYDAAFCNFVRNAPRFNGGHNGPGRPRPLQDDSLSCSKAADRLIEANKRGEFTIAPRPSLVPGRGESNIRMLPKGRGT